MFNNPNGIIKILNKPQDLIWLATQIQFSKFWTAIQICFVYFLPDIGYESEYNLYSSSGMNAETHWFLSK